MKMCGFDSGCRIIDLLQLLVVVGSDETVSESERSRQEVSEKGIVVEEGEEEERKN